eukprot:GHVO01023255.1.p1 GENE.GHVO01023255.1~~GHVO01023255.1.p1  ORF type:complete len:272 (+),score=43.10 GHVO01023255.1:64-879(+)
MHHVVSNGGDDDMPRGAGGGNWDAARPSDSAGPMSASLQYAYCDPLLNLEMKELRMKLAEKETEVKKYKDEMQAGSFLSESVLGRRLISKCRALQDENAELGKALAEGQLQPLQVQITSSQKQLNYYRTQMKALQELNTDLDEENENLTQQVQEMTRRYHASQTEKESIQAEVVSLQKTIESSREKKRESNAETSSGRAPPPSKSEKESPRGRETYREHRPTAGGSSGKNSRSSRRDSDRDRDGRKKDSDRDRKRDKRGGSDSRRGRDDRD